MGEREGLGGCARGEGGSCGWCDSPKGTSAPGFRIRIHVFFGLPDPDLLVRGMDPDPALDPDPSIIMQK